MSEIDNELRAANACRQVLARHGIVNRACTLVLFAMVDADLSYIEAVQQWAEYETPGGWDAFRWHTELCRVLLLNWVHESPGPFFDKLAEEVLAGAH